VSRRRTFGQEIHRLRTAKKMTLDDLSERSGVSKTYIWELEKDFMEMRRVSVAILVRLSIGLDVPVADLVPFFLP
jgi:transcriptional regulator with XRE-family HTH domain